MQGPITGFNYQSLIGGLEKSAFIKSYARTMKGVHSASIKLRQFKFGMPENEDDVKGLEYRKFFYNESGNVIKKLSFNNEGELEMKEEYEYFDNGKILKSKIITLDSLIDESYVYDSKGNLTEYVFRDTKKGYQKSEKNELDAKGRLLKTTSFGLMGTPELISIYVYPDGADKNYIFKHVTKPDGKLVMTFYFEYGAHNKESYISGLYGFFLSPDEVTKLMGKKDSQWEQASDFKSIWEFKAGKQTTYTRDEKIQKTNFDLGYPIEDGRIVTEHSSFEYDLIRGKNYLVKTTEWLPRFMEPCKELKTYSYYDEKGNQILPAK
jgi:hypothetical protein